METDWTSNVCFTGDRSLLSSVQGDPGTCATGGLRTCWLSRWHQWAQSAMDAQGPELTPAAERESDGRLRVGLRPVWVTRNNSLVWECCTPGLGLPRVCTPLRTTQLSTSDLCTYACAIFLHLDYENPQRAATPHSVHTRTPGPSLRTGHRHRQPPWPTAVSTQV